MSNGLNKVIPIETFLKLRREIESPGSIYIRGRKNKTLFLTYITIHLLKDPRNIQSLTRKYLHYTLSSFNENPISISSINKNIHELINLGKISLFRKKGNDNEYIKLEEPSIFISQNHTKGTPSTIIDFDEIRLFGKSYITYWFMNYFHLILNDKENLIRASVLENSYSLSSDDMRAIRSISKGKLIINSEKNRVTGNLRWELNGGDSVQKLNGYKTSYLYLPRSYRFLESNEKIREHKFLNITDEWITEQLHSLVPCEKQSELKIYRPDKDNPGKMILHEHRDNETTTNANYQKSVYLTSGFTNKYVRNKIADYAFNNYVSAMNKYLNGFDPNSLMKKHWMGIL